MIDVKQSTDIANYCRELAGECDGDGDPVTVAAKLNTLAEMVDNHNQVISGIDIIAAVRRKHP